MPFPSNVQFTPITVGGKPPTANVDPAFPASLDIVGNSQFPPAYFAYDGRNVYFRFRLRGDPRSRTGFLNQTWGVLLDLNNDPSSYEWMFTLNGGTSHINLIQNTSVGSNPLTDPAERNNFSRPVNNFDLARATPTQEGSNFGGQENYFLDFFVDQGTFFSQLVINANTVVRFLFFTSTLANQVNRDYLPFSDPVTLNQANVRAQLSVSQSLVNPPSVIPSGSIASLNGRFTVSNTGSSAASSVFATIPFLPERVDSFRITSVNIGNANFNALTSTLSWNIGTLASGATVELTYNLGAVFNQAGTRPFNSFTVTGIDQFTGNMLPNITGSLEVTVQAGGSLSGIVQNTNGLPQPDVAVTLTAQGSTVPYASTATNSDGVYSLTNVPPGNYTLSLTNPLFLPQTIAVSIAANTGAVLNVLLQPLPATLQGTVTSALDGAPVPGAVLNVSNQSNVRIATVTTDANGQYSLGNLPSGVTLTVSVAAPNFQLQNADFFLEPGIVRVFNPVLAPSPASVSGTISGADGLPIAGATVTVLDRNSNVQAETVTNATGQYTISSLVPGAAYQIRATAPGFQTSLSGLQTAPGEAATLNFILQPSPGSITGIVTEEGTGLPLEGISVRVYDSRDVTVDTTLTDAGGLYAIASLPPGSYTLLFSSSAFAARTIGATVRPGENTVVNVRLVRLTGSMEGFVRTTSGLPLVGASISVIDNGTVVARDTADAEGEFLISGLFPKSYTVNAAAEGFATKTLGVFIRPLETSVLEFALESTTGIIRGTATDSAGAPLAGAVIGLNSNLLGISMLRERTVTDNQGIFLLRDIAPGDYVLSIMLRGFQNAIISTTVRADTLTTLSIPLLPNPGSIQGTVVDDEGAPIAPAVSVNVRINDINGGLAATPPVDSASQFRADDLAPGTYSVLASATGYRTESATVTVLSGQETATTIVLAPLPGSIQGTIADRQTRLPIGGAMVKAVTQNGIILGIAMTDQNGFYQIDGLRPGSYVVLTQAQNYNIAQTGAIIKPDTVTQTDILLDQLPGSIEGRVEPPVPRILVQLYTLQNTPVSSVYSQEDGTFRFTNLAASQYILNANAVAYSSGPVGALVAPGQTANCIIQLFANPGTVSGTITAGNGRPLPNAVVQVLDRNESPRGRAQTDSAGRYFIGELPAGILSLVASAPGFASESLAVQLQPGQELAGIDFALSPNPGGISGLVTDLATDLPINGAEVNIRFSEASGLSVAAVTTSQFGEFLVTDLAPSSYALTVFAPGYQTGFIGAIVESDQITNASVMLAAQPGTIRGQVLTVDDAELTSNNTYIKLFTSSGTLIQTLFADSSGRFVIENLAPDIYSLSATAEDHATDSQTVLLGPGELKLVVFRLVPVLSFVSGIVTDAVTRLPIAGALVTVNSRTTLPIDTTFTDQLGQFMFDSISAGRRVLTVTADGYGTFTSGILAGAGFTTTFLRVELEPLPGAVFGFVTNIEDGSAIAGAEVTLLTDAQETFATIISDISGSYAFRLLSPGRYLSFASAQGFALQNGTFTVGPGETTKASFTLQPLPGSFTGHITDKATGAPLNSIGIFVRHLNNFAQVAGLGSTDAEGFFRIDNLPAGNYVVNISEIGFVATQSSFFVGRGETVRRDFPLARTSSIIIGDVTNENGTKLPGSLVVATDPNGVIVGQGAADNEGRFSVGTGTGTPGELLHVVGVADGQQVQLADVTVPNEGTLRVDLTLPANKSAVLGQVQNQQTGAPVSNMIITAFTESRVYLVSVASDAEGMYTINNLSQGTYIISVSGQSYGSTAAVVTVPASGVVRLNLQVPTAFGTLMGRIFDQNGRMLYEALSEVFLPNEARQTVQVQALRPQPSSGNGYGGLPDAFTFMRSVISNESGQYSLSNLPVGTLGALFSFPGKQSKRVGFIINNNQTTYLDVVLLDEEEPEE